MRAIVPRIVLCTLLATAALATGPAVARSGGGGHGGGHGGGMHGGGHIRVHGSGSAPQGFAGGFGRRNRGSGFGQNGDGFSDYAPYGRPVYGCDPSTPARRVYYCY